MQLPGTASRVDDAIEALDRLGGVCAFMLFPPEAADADALVEALPWVQGGTPPASVAPGLDTNPNWSDHSSTHPIIPSPMLPTITRISAVDACADSLRRAILRGELATGSRLPPERSLAAQMTVNRVTLRSALGRLAGEGLLSVRQGSGYEVQDFRRRAGPDLIAEIAAIAGTRGRASVMADLLLVRRHLARAVLEKLEGGASERARARIAAAVDALEVLVERRVSIDEIAQADAEVMANVVEASGSAVLQLCLNPILSVARTLPDLREAIFLDARESVAAWRALLAWLDHGARGGVEPMTAALAARDAQTLKRLDPPRRKGR